MSRRNTLIKKIKSIRMSTKKEQSFGGNTFFDVKKRKSLENLNLDSSPTPSLNSTESDSSYSSDNSLNILDFCVKIK